MFSKLFLLALAASPLVAAHGKVAAIQGDAGGNTTGLGIQGGVVPGAGPNSKTEVDTTVFGSIRAESDGLGRTTGQGKNKVAMVSQAMELSGTTLPQVSATDGQLTGTYHIVTSDGAGPLKAVLDTTGTGDFSQGTAMDVTTQVPGVKGNIAPDSVSTKSVVDMFTRALASAGLMKRAAANINKDYVRFSLSSRLVSYSLQSLIVSPWPLLSPPARRARAPSGPSRTCASPRLPTPTRPVPLAVLLPSRWWAPPTAQLPDVPSSSAARQ